MPRGMYHISFNIYYEGGKNRRFNETPGKFCAKKKVSRFAHLFFSYCASVLNTASLTVTAYFFFSSVIHFSSR